MRCAPDQVRTVACVGAGVIGSGWVAYYLSRGFDVRAWDPAPETEGRLRALVEAAWPALTELGLAPSAPESLYLKRRLLADLDDATPDDVVIASSTSGFGMSEMAAQARGAHRLVVAHPFNPPCLIPLVEVVGGRQTEAEVLTWAGDFFRGIGKSVIMMDREVPGFVANRLQEALWREALHMVANGEATVEQIDTSITAGPGLRWAFQDPMLTFHLAGGPGGMRHMLDHFGPSLLEPWTRLAAPELTPHLREAVIAGCEQEAGGRSIADLVRERDRHLVDLVRAQRRAPGSRT